MTVVWQSSGDSLADFDSVDAGITVAAGGLRPNRFAVADGSGVSEARKTVGSFTAYAVRWYASLAATVPGPAMFRGYAAAGGAIVRVDFNSSGMLRLIPNGPGVAWASDVAYPLNTVLRHELTVDAAGMGTLSVYNGDGTSPIMSGSGNVVAGTLAAVGFGRCTSASTSTGLTLDDLAVADAATQIGPAAAVVTTAPVLSRIESDGSLTPYQISTL